MMTDSNDMVHEAMKSIEGISRATPPPFIAVRVLNRVSHQQSPGIWEKAAQVFQRPSVAVILVLIILFLNGYFLTGSSAAVESASSLPSLYNSMNDYVAVENEINWP